MCRCIVSVVGRSFAAYLRIYIIIIIYYGIICSAKLRKTRLAQFPPTSNESLSSPQQQPPSVYYIEHNNLPLPITVYGYVVYYVVRSIHLYIAPFSSRRETASANLQYRRHRRRCRRNPRTIQIRAFPLAVVARHIYEVFQDCGQQLAQCARPTPARSTWWRHQRMAWTRRATYFSSVGVNNRL